MRSNDSQQAQEKHTVQEPPIPVYFDLNVVSISSLGIERDMVQAFTVYES
jgi:hypothetical protein